MNTTATHNSLSSWRGQLWLSGPGLAITPLILIALILALLLPSISWGQTLDIPTIESIEQAAGTRDTDESRRILGTMLDRFGEDPFATIGETNSTMFGSMFFTFNVVLFAIGVAYIGWTVLTQIAVSASQGEVLGRQMSGVWLPVRMTLGTFGMLPVFNGFSLAQAIMMYFAILGIGLANMISNAVIEKNMNFQAVIPPPGLSRPVGVQSVNAEIGQTLFQMNVCVNASEAYQTFADRVFSYSLSDPEVKINEQEQSITSVGTRTSCGEVRMSDTGPRERNSLLGYRNEAINYEKIAELASQIREVRFRALVQAQREIAPLAAQWFNNYAQATEELSTGGQVSAPTDTGLLVYPQKEIDAAIQRAIDYEVQEIQRASANFADGNNQALSESVIARMKEGGWMTIGAWNNTFAENNAALQSAASSTWLSPVAPQDDVNGVFANDYVRTVLQAVNVSRVTLMDMAKIDAWQTATGNVSAGQAITNSLLQFIAADSGGTGMVNPILVAKQLGDVMIGFVSTVVGAKLLSKVKNLIPGVGQVLGAVGDQIDISSDSMWGQILVYLLLALFFLGAVFSFYIPFIPFISWYSALTGYFMTVLEGLVAAQVWAFSHLNAEGEGVGRQAGAGYIYVLNMLLRPGLMVLGFFFAGALCSLLGTFLLHQIATAIANVQGDGMTGPLSILGFMAVVAILLFTLIQSCFNLIHEIPDRVISWFGAHANGGSFARNMDQDIKGQTETVARWAGRTGGGAVSMAR